MIYANIDAVIAANKERGDHFFDADTMGFFSSRIESGMIGGRFFITSEQDEYTDQPRLYTVRRANGDGTIDTVGNFQQFETLVEARAEAERLAEEEQA